MKSTASFVADQRNSPVTIYVDREIVPRAQAKITEFASGVILGGGFRESFRLVCARVAFLERHLRRLFQSLQVISTGLGRTPAEITKIFHRLPAANALHEGVRIRLLVIRGEKPTPTQDPCLAIGSPSIVIVPDRKCVDTSLRTEGSRLAAVPTNLITALPRAIAAGNDEALTGGPTGWVSSCDAADSLMVCSGRVWTSTRRCCFNGITRQQVIGIARERCIPLIEDDSSLSGVYSADEAVVTGTFPGLLPVAAIQASVGSGGSSSVASQVAEACP